MNSSVFESFRLVGGTALSLQLGHRLSIDIDLFSDAPYNSINFKAIDEFIEKTFPYHHHFSNLDTTMGKSYSVGTDKDNVVKLDVFYTDNFIQPSLIEDGIRIATTEEIIAMKIDVVQRIGRKKIFGTCMSCYPNTIFLPCFLCIKNVIHTHMMKNSY
ncbi:nucleotidyl transferase AbiEii/AbiGii toxin family protein [Pseudarcicella hirudinis]|uniref:nucleotidyl transferase AbiEii/AbiGii toxin family protein n=1 Tax=Pseudarcicella hirudinis TaxID=1079859 RepID=UPI0035EED9BC